MDKDKTGGTPPDLELESILAEYAPQGGNPPAKGETPTQTPTKNETPAQPSDKGEKPAQTPKKEEKPPKNPTKEEKTTQKTPKKERESQSPAKGDKRQSGGGKQAAAAGKKGGHDPIFDTPPVEEGEEPTLRLLSKDGKLVRAVPVGEKSARRTERRERPEKGPARTGQDSAPAETAKPETGGEEKLPWWKRRQQPIHRSEKVIELPDDQNLTGRIGKLIERADAYAESMFPDDNGPDPEEVRREKLLPGVDYEDEPTHAPVPRKKRAERPKPDLPPAQLAKRLGRGLRFLHARTFLSFLWCIPQIYLMLSGTLGLPMLPVLAQNSALRCQLAAAGLLVSALLALDVLGQGIKALFCLHLESESILFFAVAAAVADALTMSIFGSRGEDAAPFCGVVAVALFFALWGRFLKRSALRQGCRVAASASEPYLVTLDEKMWNGQDAYLKRSEEPAGYGSQVQATDGLQ